MPGIKKNLDVVKLSDTLVGEINPQNVCMSPILPPNNQKARELPQFQLSSKRNDRWLTIGARNPYAIINAKLLRKKNPVIKFKQRSSRFCHDKLQQYLGSMTKGLNLKYEQLFDPAYKSPLFSYHKGKDTGNNGEHQVEVAAARGPCTTAPTWIPTTAPWAASLPLKFDAPQQGNGLDCWLISAMCSITWCTPDFFKPTYTNGIFVLEDPTPPITQAELNAAWIYPDARMPLPSGSPSNSTSFWWTRSKYNELWPAMIEKAYAKQRLKSDTPNLCSIGKGDPQYALIVLKGNLNALRFRNITTNGAVPTWEKENSTTQYNSEGIWTLLNSTACTHPYPNNAFRKTRNPTVAWTYDSGDPNITHQTVANAAPSGSGVDYNSDLLVACHAYSLLGTYQKYSAAPNPNPKYVVLRNPWGLITSATRVNAQALQLTTDNLPKFTGSNPNWVDLVLWDSTAPTGKLKDGIFALEHTKFCKYFRGFSWV